MLSEQKAQEFKETPNAEAITTAPVEETKVIDAEGTDNAAPTDGAEQPKKDSVVPYGALHEERQRRKQWEADAKAKDAQLQQFLQAQAQRDQEYTIAQQRLAQMLAAQTQPPPPDKQADPLAYMVHQTEQTAAQLQALQQQTVQRQQQEWQTQQQMARQQAAEQQQRQLVQLTVSSEQQFRAQKADYDEAVKFAKTQRTKELIAVGYDETQAQQMAQHEGWQLAHQWLSQGMNPAERAYALAQSMGYQPKTIDPEQREQMHEAGRAASKPTGGGNVRGRLTAQQLAQMTPTQLARVSDEDFRAAMGG